MNLEGIVVKHKAFGKGIVKQQDKDYILISFSQGEKRFVYPDAFEKFIKAEDTSVQEAVMNEISAVKQAAGNAHAAEEVRTASARQTAALSIRNIEAGFRSDYNVEHLARHLILTYKQVEKKFGIRISGFGRGINITPATIVLISSVKKKKTGFVYHDHWNKNGDYIYSGEGKTGDQKMSSGNSAIVNASREGKVIHLFVKFSPQEYYYQGVFELVDYNYEDDEDEAGNARKEYKFRLRKVNEGT